MNKFHVVIRNDALYVEQCDDEECPWEHQEMPDLPTHHRAKITDLTEKNE